MDQDVSLWRRAADGDSAAFLELYDRHSRKVYSLALRMLNDSQEAETITQTVFLRLWQQPRRYDPERARLTTWLLAVTRNASIDRIRQLGRQRLVFDGEAAVLARSEDRNALEQLIRDEMTQGIAWALSEIPAEQRAAIYLNFYDDLSHSEIARVLNQPLGTVKTRIKLGLKKLQEALGRDRP